MSAAITFDCPGDFASSRAAEHWLTQHGFSYGPSQADGPQAIWYGAYSISKWRNLSAAEKCAADALLSASRTGKASITLSATASPDARVAFAAATAATETTADGVLI